MTEPLHVQVARALGWTELAETRFAISPECVLIEWEGRPPMWLAMWGTQCTLDQGRRGVSSVHGYATDWRLAGALIEKFGLGVDPVDDGFHDTHGAWVANSRGQVAYADTPLHAVCNLLLALHAAGKLNP